MADVRIEDNTQAVLAAMRAGAVRGLEIVGGKAETYAKALSAPIDTGALRNSITHQVDAGKLQVTIGSNVEYAPYVELGTGKLYSPPPEWIEFQAKRGRGLDHWFYRDEKGDWHVGFPHEGRKFLQNGIKNHLNEFKNIIKAELSR